jgi:NADPH:quinone reductase-like Zn-dependent oxidoreductase
MMRALRFASYGPPTVLSFDEVEIPDFQPGEVLVEVYASAINPSDVKIVGGVFTPSLPRIPGRDFAGMVIDGTSRDRGCPVHDAWTALVHTADVQPGEKILITGAAGAVGLGETCPASAAEVTTCETAQSGSRSLH